MRFERKCTLKVSLKIAFTGAESTGKTTLVNGLCKKYPDLEVITSFTRSIPNYLDKTSDVQKQLLAVYTKRLMDVASKGFICDRTLFDVCAYSMVKGVWTDSYVRGVLDMYTRTSIFPDYLFYTPIEFPMVQDGGRPEGTREFIDGYIQEFLEEHAPVDFIVLTGSVEERMATINRVIK